MGDNIPPGPGFEQHFTVYEIAESWGLSTTQIIRIFENEPGVVIFRAPPKKYKRAYRTLRIPKSVAQRVYQKCIVQPGEKERVLEWMKKVAAQIQQPRT